MTVQLQKKKRLKKHGLFGRMARRNPFLSESSSFWFAKLYLSKLQAFRKNSPLDQENQSGDVYI